jgi:hypothetical protein
MTTKSPSVCIFVSELAALIGRNRYKSEEEAMITVMNRSSLVHPLSKETKEKEDKLTAVVKHVQTRVSTPAPQATVDKVATQHKINAAVLAEAVKAPETQHLLPASVKAAVQAVQETVKKEALQEAIVQNNVPEKTAAEAVRSKEACDHGTQKEDTTRQLYNQRHRGTARFEQKPVKQTFMTPNGNNYILFGRLDGYDVKEDCVVEYKNRMRRLFEYVPDYELPQLYAYMALTSTKRAKQVEQFGEDTLVHEVRFDEEEWETIRAAMGNAVDKMHTIDQIAWSGI